jgi:hypothetical protein
MKKVKALFIALFTIAFITGCGSSIPLNEEPDVVYKTRLIPISIPQHMTEPVEVPKPPTKNDYIFDSAEDKEGKLTEYTIQLLMALDKANITIKGIRDFVNKQNLLFKDKIANTQ